MRRPARAPGWRAASPCGGLADAAGDRRPRRPAKRARAKPPRRLKRRQRVVHAQQRLRPAKTCAMHHRAGRAPAPARRRRRHARRRPRRAARRTDRPARSVRVSIDTPVGRERRGHRAAGRLDQFGRGPQGHRSCASAPGSGQECRQPTHRRHIVERQTSPPMVWPCSWPLPATTSTSPGAEQIGQRRRDRRVAVADLAAARTAPASIAARIAAGSSLRGLSSVTIATSASRAARRAHQRPLARIAVAAGAEHHVQPARGMRAQRRQQPLQRVRRVGVIDIDRGAVRQPRGQLHAGRARRAAPAAGPAGRRTPVASASAAASSALSAWKRPGSGRSHVPPHAAGHRPPDPVRPAAAAPPSSGSPSPPLADGAKIEPPPRAMSRSAASVAASMSAFATAGAPCGQQIRRTAAAWPRGRRAIGAVIIQMVARQVGERRRGQPHAVQPELIEPVRGRLHRRVLRCRRAARPASVSRQADRIGRGQARTGLEPRRDQAERAQAGGLRPPQRPDLAQELDRAGLAVGAGDRDHRRRLPPGQHGGDLRQSAAAAPGRGSAAAAARHPARPSLARQHCRRATRHRLRNERPAVRLRPG